MEKENLISIIIPVYNRQELVKDALDSVLAQTYQAWECIVIDDGSTDDTWTVLKKYAQKDNRFKIHKRNREPKGAPTCRNIGFEISTSNFVIFFDSDDLLAPWCLETRNLSISKYKKKEIDVLLSQSFEFNNNDLSNRRLRSSYGIDEVLSEFLNYEIPFGTPNPTWRKAFLQDNKISWYENLAVIQDVMFHINAFNYNPAFTWSEEIPDVFIRVEEGYAKISNTNEIGKVLSRLDLLNDLHLFTSNSTFKRKFKIDILNRLEHLTYNDLKNILIKHSGKIKLNLGFRTLQYLIIYNRTRNIKCLRGVIYRMRFVFTFKRRNNILRNTPHISEVLFESLKKKYKAYPDKTKKINSLE